MATDGIGIQNIQYMVVVNDTKNEVSVEEVPTLVIVDSDVDAGTELSVILDPDEETLGSIHVSESRSEFFSEEISPTTVLIQEIPTELSILEEVSVVVEATCDQGPSGPPGTVGPQGPPGPAGPQGPPGSGSGGNANLDDYPLADSEELPSMFIVRQSNGWVRTSFEQTLAWIAETLESQVLAGTDTVFADDQLVITGN